MSPCLVNSFVATSPPFGIITYELGSTELAFGPYKFEQSPNCGYNQLITFQDLPQEFVTHNPVSRSFKIEQTLDQDFLGDYLVTIQSEF